MGYIAVVPELAGCSVFGETEEEALKEVTAATELWLETAEKEWRGIPQPAGKELLKAFVEEKIDSKIREMGGNWWGYCRKIRPCSYEDRDLSI